MGDLIRATKYVCAKCQYRCRFGTAPSGKQSLYNYCCNYLEIMGESRIFDKHGNMRFDPKYCEHFEEGDMLPGRFDFNAHTNSEVYESGKDDNTADRGSCK